MISSKAVNVPLLSLVVIYYVYASLIVLRSDDHVEWILGVGCWQLCTHCSSQLPSIWLGCCRVSDVLSVGLCLLQSLGVRVAEKNHEKPLLISGHLCMLFLPSCLLCQLRVLLILSKNCQMSLSSSGSLYSSSFERHLRFLCYKHVLWGLFLS